MNNVSHDMAHAVTAQIVNLLSGDFPGGKAELYGRIYFLIVVVVSDAIEENGERWRKPSTN